jgi:putative methyltransferase (TIGR04325 family)
MNEVRWLWEKVLTKFGRRFFRLYNKVDRYIKDIIIYLTFFNQYGGSGRLGPFKTFEEAMKYLEKYRNKFQRVGGWDVYLNKWGASLSIMHDYEYQVGFHLCNLINHINRPVRIFELGGTGTFYLKLKKRGVFDGKTITYQICNLPEVIRKIKEIFPDLKDEVKFTSDILDARGSDIFIAIQTIRCIENFFEIFSSLEDFPKYVIIAPEPVHEELGSFVVLQNLDVDIMPHWVYNKKSILSFFNNLGYELIDEFRTKIEMIVPFYRKATLNYFTGLVFKRGYA